ncbi:MAG TPA: alpha/beta fold hydrolase [Thermoleophilaceae bacterium]
MRRAAATLFLTALVAGCGGHHSSTTSTAPAAGGAPAGKLSAMEPCHGLKHASCATLTVPLDHSGKVSGELKLRVAFAGPDHPSRGTALFLTGGPGEIGVPFISRIESELAPAVKGYRVVMLDQRGTGSGALNCRALQSAVGASDLAVPPLPALRACAAKIGPKRRFYNTDDTVADFEALRGALGLKRWAVVNGVSYGTFVGERYSLAHPGSVGKLVLDSVVPHVGINPFQLESIHAVPRVLRSACAETHCHSDVVGDLAAVVRKLHDGPALLDSLVTLSIADPDYRAVPRALSDARAGNTARLDRMLAGTRRGDRLPASFLDQGLHDSTLCGDFPQPWGGPSVPIATRKTVMQGEGAKLTAADVFPFDKATATGNGELITCLNWPPLALRPPRVPRQLPRLPVLLLAGERDLSTPLEWAQDEARAAPEGKLVVARRSGHSVQLRGKDPAARAALIRFMQSG